MIAFQQLRPNCFGWTDTAHISMPRNSVFKIRGTLLRVLSMVTPAMGGTRGKACSFKTLKLKILAINDFL